VNPAYAVILFSTASAAGYGLLAAMGIFAAGEAVPQNRWFGVLGFGLAFGAITIGLLASASHLGHPERAWRAFSQWRSSWLSRAGIFAVATYVPGLLFAFGWVVMEDYTGPWRMFGTITAVFSVFAVYCSAMTYATLRPIIAWSNRHTVRVLMLLAAWNGLLWFYLLAQMFDVSSPMIAAATMLAGFLSFLMKRRYWRFIDTNRSPVTPETATGLARLGPVRLLEAPNTQDNYVQNEMVFVIARRHVEKLRRMVFLFAFAVPWALVLATMEGGHWTTVPGALAAVISVTIGMWTERWLFFAEAKHTAALYYGEREV
jgi:DMSO reductase anchor subunit